MEEQMAPASQQEIISNSGQTAVQSAENQPVGQNTAVEYAGFWDRVAGYLVDSLVVILPVLLVRFVFGAIAGSFLGAVGVWAYNVYMLKFKQATLGKMALGIKVTTVDGQKPEMGAILMREILGKILNSLTASVGYLMVAFTEKKQGLHDMIADTVVVNDPARKKKKWIVVVAVVVFLIVPILGIFSGIFLVSTKGAQNKAYDVATKKYMDAIITDAGLFAIDHGYSYAGFEASSQIKFPTCSKSPQINVSADGKSMAVIAQSCYDPKTYFCLDANASKPGSSIGTILNKDSVFASSKRTSCTDAPDAVAAQSSSSAQGAYDSANTQQGSGSGIAQRVADNTYAVSPNVPTANDASTIDIPGFDFVGTSYAFGWQGGDETTSQIMYEFYPKGENSDNFSKIITIVRDKSANGQSTPEGNADMFQRTLQGMRSEGASIKENFVVENKQDPMKNINVAVLAFVTSTTSGEIDIKKAFISNAGESIGVTYGIRVKGDGVPRFEDSFTAELEKIRSEEFKNEFIATKFPFPWEK